MEHLFENIVELMKSGKRAVFALVVKTDGSTPRKAGAKMIIMKDGSTVGTLGGGDLEIRMIQEAINVIKQGQPKIVSFTLDVGKGKVDMMCGGELDVYREE